MDKRTFLKTSGILAGGVMISPFIGCNEEKNFQEAKLYPIGPVI